MAHSVQTSAKRAIFVDDDPLVLNGLQRSLRHLKSKWAMQFVVGAREALAAMDATPFDVLVTDMHMPGMSGADLIAEVYRRHPATIRVILSGQADQAKLLRCMPLAHRFLPKPCAPSEIERILDRIGSIEDSLELDRVREVIARLTHIPSVPSVYLKILDTLQDPDAGIVEVADVVAQDPGTTSGLLRVVNSAYFGLSRRITDAQEAVRFLGLDLVRTLALAIGAFDQLRARPIPHFSVEELWQHSMATGSLARTIARLEGLPTAMQDQCFVAGLLHDLGRLIIADNLAEDWQRIVDYALREKCPAQVAEAAIINVTHAEIAGGLFGLWGLPGDLVDAILHHHTPHRVTTDSLSLALAVHCADHLVREREGDAGLFASAELDHACIRQAGLAGRLEVWSRNAVEGPPHENPS